MVRIPAEERLMNLTVALLGTETGLTRAQIYASVSGYSERILEGRDEATLERMFERDKEALTSLGMPLELVGNVSNPRDMREARYRIPRHDSALPEDLEFTAIELALLSLAADAWGEATMSREAQAGMRKIRALGLDVDEPILGVRPRLDAREASFAPLEQAIERRVEVQFDYLRPGIDHMRRRTVQPRALVLFDGRWHLDAWDTDAGGDRTFLLARIVGDVVLTGTRFVLDDPEKRAEEALAELHAVADRQRAVVAVVPGSEADMRLRRRAAEIDDNGRIVVPCVDPYIFAGEIASYGPEATVISPASLASLVAERLREAIDVHTGSAEIPLHDVPVQATRRAGLVSVERVRIYLTLVPWLIERGEVSVATAAEQFDVTEREMRGMVSTLTLVGAPSDDGYPSEMFDLDWDLFERDDRISLTHTVGIERVQRFTTRETAALIAGLQLLRSLPGIADAEQIDALRRKLTRGSTAPAGMSIVVDDDQDPLRAELARAIAERRQVRFAYRRPEGKPMRRTVDPARLLQSEGEWYLQGWCHLREAPRTFLLERMADLVVTDDHARRADDITAELFTPTADDTIVTLRFPTEMRVVLADYLAHAQLTTDDASTIARIPVADIGVVKRLASREGGKLEVLAPREARELARSWAVAGVNHSDSP